MMQKPSCSCPVTTELFTLLGKKWSLFILHSVSRGYHTFTTIREHIGNPNTKILTDRLGELVEAGMLEKCQKEGSYHLSQNGEKLIKKLIKVCDWWGKTS